MSKGKMIIVIAIVAFVAWYFGSSIEHGVKEYLNPSFSATKTRMAKDFEANVSKDVKKNLKYDRNGKRIVYASDEQYQQALKKAFERTNNNSDFVNSLQGDGTQSTAQQPSASPLPAPPADLPITPTEVEDSVGVDGRLTIAWPIRKAEWVSLGFANYGMKFWADRNGQIWDQEFSQFGIMGPGGRGRPCSDRTISAQQPVPGGWSYAVYLKFGQGPPIKAPTTEEEALIAMGAVEVFVRINDIDPSTLYGSMPINCKR